MNGYLIHLAHEREHNYTGLVSGKHHPVKVLFVAWSILHAHGSCVAIWWPMRDSERMWDMESESSLPVILDGPGALCCTVLSYWLFATYLLFRWHMFGLVIGMMSLRTMRVWHVFACGCNMFPVWRWVKKRRKIRSTIKMAASRTGTWAPRIYAIIKMLLGFCLLTGEVAGLLASSGLEPRRQTTVLPWRVVSRFLFMLFFNVFFEVVRWRLHHKVQIRSLRRILVSVMCLASNKGVWRCSSWGSPWIQSVFVFIGLILGQTLPIYGYHHCWWLLHWSFGALGRWLHVSLP
jgi:hypothetical protein